MSRVHIDPEKLKPDPVIEDSDAGFEYYGYHKYKSKPGRPAFEPHPWQRYLAQDLAGKGVPEQSIAVLLEISSNTLTAYLSEELARGRAQAHAVAAGVLFKKVVEGSPWAVQFYMARFMGWIEPKHPQDDAPDDDLSKLSDDELQSEIDAISEAEGVASEARGLATRLSR